MRSTPTTTPPPRAVRTAASRARRLATPALVVGAAVILAACGSSGSTTKSSSSKSSSTTKAASPSSTTVVVKTATNSQLGTILVDSSGKTLYTLTNGGQAVACTGGCLVAWPPLLLPAGTSTATGGSGVTGLATVPATGGTQVTQNGLPLYRFAADAAAGDANGEGASSFGGVWHVVKVTGDSGAAGGTSSSSSTTSTTKKYSSGY